MGERQSGNEHKGFKAAAGVLLAGAALAGVEAGVVVPNNSENSDNLIEASSLGDVPGEIQSAFADREVSGHIASLQDLQQLQEALDEHGNLQLRYDTMHEMVSADGETYTEDMSTPEQDAIGPLTELDAPRLVLAGEVAFASTSGLDTYQAKAIGPDGTPLFTEIEEASTVMTMINPTIAIEDTGLAFSAFDQERGTDVKVVITWSELAEGMGTDQEHTSFTVNGKHLSVDLPNALEEVLVNNDHEGNYATAEDLSPIPVSDNPGEVSQFNQGVEKASADATKQVQEKLLPFVQKVDATNQLGEQRIGHITGEDGRPMTIFLDAGTVSELG